MRNILTEVTAPLDLLILINTEVHSWLGGGSYYTFNQEADSGRSLSSNTAWSTE